LKHDDIPQNDYEDWRIDCKVYKSSNPTKEQTERQYKDDYKEKQKEKYTHKIKKHKTYNRPLSAKVAETSKLQRAATQHKTNR